MSGRDKEAGREKTSVEAFLSAPLNLSRHGRTWAFEATKIAMFMHAFPRRWMGGASGRIIIMKLCLRSQAEDEECIFG
ncbi:MAG TPA: hypothetical protein VKF36_05910 [Syntrophorhabdales bacterium]|nr:hypothetical protein [Syntrophorhabdales bacterium]